MQNLNEGLPELHVEGGVNDGIDGAVDVAQPSEGVVHLGGDLASCAVGVQDVGDEKRQPAYDEDTWRGGGKGLQDKEERLKHVTPASVSFKQEDSLLPSFRQAPRARDDMSLRLGFVSPSLPIVLVVATCPLSPPPPPRNELRAPDVARSHPACESAALSSTSSAPLNHCLCCMEGFF